MGGGGGSLVHPLSLSSSPAMREPTAHTAPATNPSKKLTFVVVVDILEREIHSNIKKKKKKKSIAQRCNKRRRRRRKKKGGSDRFGAGVC
jgi:hypothetical protein